MRNIKDFPLTVDECLETLVKQHTTIANQRPIIFGDLRAYTLTTIYDFLVENRVEFAKYLNETTD